MGPKEAYLDDDGKLSEYEKVRDEAVQWATAKDELPQMAHGRMACGCDYDEGLMLTQRRWEQRLLKWLTISQ